MGRIAVRGARENNLAGVDLDLPLGRLTVFVGPSGSGKSSLAFDTLHAEGRRRYLEAASAARGRSAGLSAPRVDAIEGLPPTLALEQRGEAPPRTATVADVSGVLPPLRLLLGRAGTLHCPRCDRPVVPRSHDEIVARILEYPEGSRLLVEAPVRRRGEASDAGVLEAVARAGFSRVRVGGEVRRLDALRPGEVGGRPIRIVVDRIRLTRSRTDRVHDAVRTAARAGGGEVVVVGPDGEEVRSVDRPYCPHDAVELPVLEPRLLDPRATPGRCAACGGRGLSDEEPCPACGGLGLSDAARAVRFRGQRLADLVGRTVDDALALAESWPVDPVTERPVAEWIGRLARLASLGLGHLPLGRRAVEVSSGELQRLRLARQVGGRLSGVLYLLDEPAAGLSDGVAAGVVDALRRLVAEGNTVVAVEHHPVVVAAADRIVEFGPGAGEAGGRIVYEGDVAGLLAADTATGRWLSGRAGFDASSEPTPAGWITAVGATDGNLRGDPVRMPRGVLAAVVGPSGAGKSRLLATLVAHLRTEGPAERPPLEVLSGTVRFARVVVVDRRAVSRSPRSNVATFTGIWSVLRELLSQTPEARIRGLSPAAFSLNVRGGRCETCRGSGVRRIDLQWLPDVFLPCPVCDGRRFTSDVLEVRWKGLSADEILALTVDAARARFCGHPDLEGRLGALAEVGLGYLPLGCAGHTWSGGEAQRLLLARELGRAHRRGARDTLFVLDDPTVGLHPSDVAVLLGLLRRLVDDGATVWLATHDRALAQACDVVIPVGPGSGPDGGRVLQT